MVEEEEEGIGTANVKVSTTPSGRTAIVKGRRDAGCIAWLQASYGSFKEKACRNKEAKWRIVS